MAPRITNADIVSRLDNLVAQTAQAHAAMDERMDKMEEAMKPVTEAYTNITGFRRVLIWFGSGLAVFGGAAMGLREVMKLWPKH